MRAFLLCKIGSFVSYYSMSIFSGIYVSQKSSREDVARNLQICSMIHFGVCILNTVFSAIDIIMVTDPSFTFGKINLVRYLEWTICSPLMVMEVCIAQGTPLVQTGFIAILTILFCMCGIITAYTNVMWVKIVVEVNGCIACIAVVYYLWSHTFYSFRSGNKRAIAGLFNTGIMVCLWPMYVLSWSLGPDMLYKINAKTELLIQNFLSIFVKSMGLSYVVFFSKEDLIEPFANIFITIMSFVGM